MDTTTSKGTTAFPPFDDPKADLIIRSSDGIHFYVHKMLLSLLSSVFEGMFAIANGTEQEFHDNRPCISVSDNSHRLGCLLVWCDPRCMRTITSLDDVQNTLEMADKYNMDFTFDLVDKTILSSRTNLELESQPLKLFAIAIRYQLENLAIEAARKTLRMPLGGLDPCQELKHISAFKFQYLLDYRLRCVKRAQQCVDQDNLLWAKISPNGLEFVFFNRRHPDGIYHTGSNWHNEPTSPRSQTSPGASWVGWWDRYMDQVSTLLNQTPCGLVAQTPSLLRDMQLIIASEKCEYCKRRGYEDLVAFSVPLSQKIDEVVSEVAFHIGE